MKNTNALAINKPYIFFIVFCCNIYSLIVFYNVERVITKFIVNKIFTIKTLNSVYISKPIKTFFILESTYLGICNQTIFNREMLKNIFLLRKNISRKK